MLSVAKEHALDDLVDFISKRLEMLEYHNDKYAGFIEDFEILIDDYMVVTEEDETNKRVLLNMLEDMYELAETHTTMIFYLKGILKISEDESNSIYDRVSNGCRMFGDLFTGLLTSSIKIITRFSRLYDVEIFCVETIYNIDDIKEQYKNVDKHLVDNTRRVYNETQLYVEKMMMIKRRLG